MNMTPDHQVNYRWPVYVIVCLFHPVESLVCVYPVWVHSQGGIEVL